MAAPTEFANREQAGRIVFAGVGGILDQSLAGRRAVPARLTEQGFAFGDTDPAATIRSALDASPEEP